jgi:hypothetical protein
VVVAVTERPSIRATAVPFSRVAHTMIAERSVTCCRYGNRTMVTSGVSGGGVTVGERRVESLRCAPGAVVR